MLPHVVINVNTSREELYKEGFYRKYLLPAELLQKGASCSAQCYSEHEPPAPLSMEQDIPIQNGAVEVKIGPRDQRFPFPSKLVVDIWEADEKAPFCRRHKYSREFRFLEIIEYELEDNRKRKLIREQKAAEKQERLMNKQQTPVTRNQKGEFEMKTQTESNLAFHPPTPEKLVAYSEIRDAATAFARELETVCPPSHETSLALTKLEESVLWAHASITRNFKPASESEKPERNI